MGQHTKHAKLIRPSGGLYHRIEFGFVGAPCSVIQSLCHTISQQLKGEFSFGFVDADHKAADDFADSYDGVYTDKINFHRFDSKNKAYFELRQSLTKHDAVLVNANHFHSDRQIVVINSTKKDSLFRKLDRLNNIELIILDDLNQPFDFITLNIDGGKVVPAFSINNLDAICNFIKNEILAAEPPLHGLIFMGGKSQRMGADKSEIVYHTEKQYNYLANLIAPSCTTVSLSVAQDEHRQLNLPLIPDTFTGLGPFGGLLSAFRKNPNHALLTLPCDTPFIDEALIEQLVSNRNSSKLATCFHNPETKFPEPLITIWEPRAYPVLLQFLAMGYSCPRKVLINSDIEELTLVDSGKLFNANTAEERDWAMEQINSLSN